MKEVCVRVPESYTVPNSMLCDGAHNVMTIGDIMYTKGMSVFNENNPETMKIALEERRQCETDVQRMKDKLELSSQNHEMQVQQVITMNKTLQDQNERMSKEYMRGITSIREEKDVIIHELRDKEITNNHAVIQKIDSLLGNGNTVDNIEKGNFGEDYVTTAITQEFPESVVDDVSSETAHCDCVWRMDSGAFRCLVEVKNVAQSKNLNVDKFVRDMNINLSNGEANCGIFVSLKTDNVPNKGRFKLEYIQNCPVVYVSGVWKNPIVFTFTLRLMKYLVQHKAVGDNDVDVIHIQEYITKTYNSMMKEQGHINEMRKLVDRMNLIIQKSQKNLTESVLFMEETMTRHGISHEGHHTVDEDNEAIEILISYNDLHGKWPTASESKLRKEQYKNRTFKNLLLSAKSMQLSRV